MFSTFSSFLPSILQPNTNPDDQRPQPADSLSPSDGHRHPDLPSTPSPEPVSHSKKKIKKDRLPNETFIVVRPPPSKSTHPLNLQVQLVPPQARQASSSATIHALDNDTSHRHNDTSDSTDHARTSCDRSDYSGYTSAASISSFASTSTTSSGRRTIIPLYNLQAHHVMTNIIVDAGTDAKVAKFAKRGLEIVGLAVFEPIEVWGPASLQGATTTSSARTSAEDQHREFPSLSPHLRPCPPPATRRPGSPDERSSTSHSTTTYDREHRPPPTINLTPATPDTSSTTDTQPQRKRLFSRMFRKKEPARSLSIAVPTQAGNLDSRLPASAATATSTQALPTTHTARDPNMSDASHLYHGIGLTAGGDSVPPTPIGGAPPMTGVAGSTTTALCPAVLGVQATLYPPIQPPTGRPTKYVWVIRRWLKGAETGLLNGMIGKLSINGRGVGSGAAGNGDAGATMQVEVRFDWSRGRKREPGRDKDRDRERTKERGSKAAESGENGRGEQPTRPTTSPSPNGSLSRKPPLPTKGLGMGPEDNRHSIVSQQSSNSDTVTATSESSAVPHNLQNQGQRPSHTTAEDSGDESDPEDSETPWTCTVTVQRLSSTSRHPHAATSTSILDGDGQTRTSSPSTSISLKVATLSPTPHHPKVVGLLKIPFPLPDIEVERLAVRKRIVTAQGVQRTTGMGEGDTSEVGLVLTAEEIKDTISSTALWLVVREAFGGVGRERKKGEGWRIRA
ncbi:hypothetical protein ID866_9901 [Astraeus odoratus]|nr:hypothetical protein ID866_9901 [Astraeus odoratus]